MNNKDRDKIFKNEDNWSEVNMMMIGDVAIKAYKFLDTSIYKLVRPCYKLEHMNGEGFDFFPHTEVIEVKNGTISSIADSNTARLEMLKRVLKPYENNMEALHAN